MILHYYLADDTLEIREVMRPNSGRDAVPVFVKRAKLPKNSQAVYPPGVITARTVLNVTLENHILDSLKTGAANQDFYTDADLQIGNVINVWGRAVKLVDCDDFTKDYYRTKYDVKSFAPVENKAHVKPSPSELIIVLIVIFIFELKCHHETSPPTMVLAPTRTRAQIATRCCRDRHKRTLKSLLRWIARAWTRVSCALFASWPLMTQCRS